VLAGQKRWFGGSEFRRFNLMLRHGGLRKCAWMDENFFKPWFYHNRRL